MKPTFDNHFWYVTFTCEKCGWTEQKHIFAAGGGAIHIMNAVNHYDECIANIDVVRSEE